MKLTDKQIALINDKFAGTFYEYCEDHEISPYSSTWFDADGHFEYDLDDDALADWRCEVYDYIKDNLKDFGFTQKQIYDKYDDIMDAIYDYVYLELEL